MPLDQIIARIKNGDREAFDIFFLEKYPSLLAYARLFFIGEDPAWAEDVVQEVLYSVWKNRQSIRADGSSLQSYLLRGVHNRSINYRQREQLLDGYRSFNQKRIFSIMEDYLSPETNPILENIFTEELRTSLESAISSLPPKCQEVFRLSYVEDLSDKEIGDKLGISVRTVESHMHTALKLLRLKLSESGLCSAVILIGSLLPQILR